jgi:hypothetical protein
MTLSSFNFAVLVAITLTVIGVLYIRKIQQTTQQRREKRTQLRQRIESLHLPKILQALGIGFGNYLYKVPIEEIDECVSLCEDCSSVVLCGETLMTSELNPDDIAFCPNQQHLSQFSRASRIQGQK